MQSRREVLFGIVSTPLASALLRYPIPRVSAGPRIIPESHVLSEESANGFRILLTRNTLEWSGLSPGVIIIPGSRALSRGKGRELLSCVARGTWLILESGLSFMPQSEAISQVRVLRDVFGLNVQLPLAISDAYVEYTWPRHQLVRDFSTITPVECSEGEVIAAFRGVAVCIKRHIGKGGIIFIGSMLGPGLLAEEKEAHQVGSAILDELWNRDNSG